MRDFTDPQPGLTQTPKAPAVVRGVGARGDAYDQTLDRVETYFDQTATKTWERLTSDAPVSKVRATVRAGRDRMREIMLAQMPENLSGKRILDAGCGAGQMTAELAHRGADVVAVDISPSLVEIASKRLPDRHRGQVSFQAGDMHCDTLGHFDHVVAMDSLIYYEATDIGQSLARLCPRVADSVIFTVAPRTPFLMAFWGVGKLFPRSDRSPVMIPHSPEKLAKAAMHSGAGGDVREIERVTSGFYISTCLEYRA